MITFFGIVMENILFLFYCFFFKYSCHMPWIRVGPFGKHKNVNDSALSPAHKDNNIIGLLK